MIRVIALLAVGALIFGIEPQTCLAADTNPAGGHGTPAAAHPATPATAHTAGDSHATPPHVTYPHPTLPAKQTLWPAPVLIVIGAMFLSAIVIGPIVRSEMPEEAPHTHSHDEPPGASGHHGHSGTIQPGPEHDHGHGHGHH